MVSHEQRLFILKFPLDNANIAENFSLSVFGGNLKQWVVAYGKFGDVSKSNVSSRTNAFVSITHIFVVPVVNRHFFSFRFFFVCV